MSLQLLHIWNQKKSDANNIKGYILLSEILHLGYSIKENYFGKILT